MLPGDRHVVEEDPALGRASDHRWALGEHERLPRAPAPGADDEDDTVEPEVVECVERVTGHADGEGLGLLTLLGHDQRRAAFRAEARGLRVVVPALGAVDVRHR